MVAVRRPLPPFATLFAVAALVAAPARTAAATADADVQVERLRTTTASPLVDGEQFRRRLFAPIEADDLVRFVAAGGRRLASEAFEAGEVDAWIPAQAPPPGYGLLVFILPDDSVALPRDWKKPLAERGIVAVVVRGAGNEVDLFSRRIPRVLDAYSLAKATWPIDPARVWIGGFSGGARVAQRIAMAWPDEFGGTLQFAGSVVVGTARLVPPPPDLAARLQERTRFVLVSGMQDTRNRANDGAARESMQALCFADVVIRGVPRLEHWMPGGRELAKALDALEAPVAADAGCRERVAADIAAALDAVEEAVASGDVGAARAALVAIDDRYGGLAAPRSVELARRMLPLLPADAASP